MRVFFPFHDESSRNVSLPPGCGNLLDAIKLEQLMKIASEAWDPDPAVEARRGQKPQPHQPFTTEPVEIGPQITIQQLAEKLSWRPQWIIIMLIPRKIFAVNADHVLGFDLAAEIARQHGYTVKAVE